MLAMQPENITNIHLQTIKCDLGDIVRRLTFVFSNNVKSPPKGNYGGTPDKQFEIAEKGLVDKLLFDLEDGDLTGLTVVDSEQLQRLKDRTISISIGR